MIAARVRKIYDCRMRLRLKLPSAFLALPLAILCAPPIDAQVTPPTPPAHHYKLLVVSMPPPQELAEPVGDAMLSTALHVSEANDPYCDIWLRASIPVADNPDKTAGVMFGEIAPGTLIGAVKFTPTVADYHNQQVQAGVYTLRYMLLPIDGNHQGRAPGRDFVVLVPAALDVATGPIAVANLMEMSRKASTTEHPSVWSLVPPPSNSPPLRDLPTLIHSDQGDLWIVYFSAPFTSAAAIGFVISGHGP
jgi:hypothetical protein